MMAAGGACSSGSGDAFRFLLSENGDASRLNVRWRKLAGAVAGGSGDGAAAGGGVDCWGAGEEGRRRKCRLSASEGGAVSSPAEEGAREAAMRLLRRGCSFRAILLLVFRGCDGLVDVGGRNARLEKLFKLCRWTSERLIRAFATPRFRHAQ